MSSEGRRRLLGDGYVRADPRCRFGLLVLASGDPEPPGSAGHDVRGGRPARATTTGPASPSTPTSWSRRSATGATDRRGGSRWPASPHRSCASGCPSTCMVLVAAMVAAARRVAGRLVGEHRPRAGDARGRDPGGWDRSGPDGGVPARRPRRRRRGVGRARAGAVGDAVREAVAARRHGPTCHALPAVSRRPVLPGRVPAARRAGAARHRTPDEMDGGHLHALARPDELVDRLEEYRSAL